MRHAPFPPLSAPSLPKSWNRNPVKHEPCTVPTCHLWISHSVEYYLREGLNKSINKLGGIVHSTKIIKINTSQNDPNALKHEINQYIFPIVTHYQPSHLAEYLAMTNIHPWNLPWNKLFRIFCIIQNSFRSMNNLLETFLKSSNSF